MNNNIITVPFHDQLLSAVLVDNIPHIAMKPICENIGVDWSAQAQKIKRHPILSKGMVIITTPSKGGIQEMLTLPLRMLNGWLFLIDSSRVKSEAKNKVLKYQEECFDVLANHFLPKQNAIVELSLITTEQKRHIQEIVNKIKRDTGTNHQTTYHSLKSQFNVGKYDELKQDQYPAVCVFLGAKPKSIEGDVLPPLQLESKQTEYSPMPYTEGKSYATAEPRIKNAISWARKNNNTKLEEDLEVVNRCLISGWTEVDEALFRLDHATSFLKRWRTK